MALVLVVDDERDIRDLVRLNLELEGHEVEVATDGADALRQVDEGLRPDLVVLDVMMPGVDGWEVLKAFKADPDEDVATTPVLMLTARATDLDRIRGGIEGAVRYLTKPFSVAVLREAVDQALAEDEGVARLAAQKAALELLARLEKGEDVGDTSIRRPEPPGRVRFSRLERRPDAPPPAHAGRPTGPTDLDVSELSPKQLELLDAVGATATVRDAASGLGVSRSNVYASLRRIARKVGVPSVPELVLLARDRSRR